MEYLLYRLIVKTKEEGRNEKKSFVYYHVINNGSC